MFTLTVTIGPMCPSILSSSSFSSHHRFKFPANEAPRKPSPFEFRAKVVGASSSTSPTSRGEESSYGDGDWVSYGRRKMSFMAATLPLVLQMPWCPDRLIVHAATAYPIIQEELRKALTKGKAAGLLRLAFHDAGTFDVDENSGGMNGSIVYELGRPENTGLKKPVKILEKVKSEVDGIKPVSWADMIAVAGAEAVSICGGPFIPIQLGRVDSLVPDPEGKLPEESLNASELKKCFRTKGFSTQELVALSGAHTIGSKGFGSPVVFDNSYYKILLEKPWMTSGGMSSMIGLPSDRALSEDGECLRWVRLYADDENKFFEDFKSAYIKLVNSGATWKKS